MPWQVKSKPEQIKEMMEKARGRLRLACVLWCGQWKMEVISLIQQISKHNNIDRVAGGCYIAKFFQLFKHVSWKTRTAIGSKSLWMGPTVAAWHCLLSCRNLKRHPMTLGEKLSVAKPYTNILWCKYLFWFSQKQTLIVVYRIAVSIGFTSCCKLFYFSGIFWSENHF